MEKDFKKILILRLSAIGDTIHTLPLAYALKKTYPDCKIGWVVEDKAQLFIKDNPLIDKCFVIPKKEWAKRGLSIDLAKDFLRITDEINAENYDVVIDTQQLYKSAMFLPLLKIKRKITLSGGREFSGLFSNEIVPASHKLFDPDYHVVKRNLELAEYLGADASEVKFVLTESSKALKEKVSTLLSGIDSSKKTIVISPATTWGNKHWRPSYWSEVINWLGSSVNLVFTGMDCDLPLIDSILGGTSCVNPIVIAGKTNLEELAEVFRRADVVVSPDSGSAHIAWAVSKPYVVTIFTATAEKRNAPFGENCYVLAPDLPCHPCMKRKCRLKGDKNICTEAVKPETLINILKPILHLD